MTETSEKYAGAAEHSAEYQAGYQKGYREGLVEILLNVLATNYGVKGSALAWRVSRIRGGNLLRHLIRQSFFSPTVEEFETHLP